MITKKIREQSNFSFAVLALLLTYAFDFFAAPEIIPNYPIIRDYRAVLSFSGIAALYLSILFRKKAFLIQALYLFIFAVTRMDEVLHILPKIHTPHILLSLFIFSNFLSVFILIFYTNFTPSALISGVFLGFAFAYEISYFFKLGDLPPILFILVIASTAATAVISRLIRIERERKKEIGILYEEEVQLRNRIALMKGRMLEQEKSFSLSMLTAGIAHELGNPINYLKGNLFFIEKYMNDLKGMIDKDSLNETQRASLDAISSDYKSILTYAEAGFNNITDIITNMKKIYGNTHASREETNLKELVVRTVEFFKVSHNNESYNLEIDIPSELYVHINQGEYYIVFSNILTNALESRDPKKDSVKISLCTQQRDGATEVLISDNGTGIDEENKDNIFDPFYSTKNMDSNLGLGLALCKEIVESDGGHISIESQKDQGSTVKIYFRDHPDET